MQARMWPTQRSQVEQLEEYGFGDPERTLMLDDLIRGQDVVFAATGITSGESLEGVRYFRGGARTHTVVMSTEPRVVRRAHPASPRCDTAFCGSFLRLWPRTHIVAGKCRAQGQ